MSIQSNIETYLLSCIDPENYGVTLASDPKSQLQFLYNTYKEEYAPKSMKEWVAGLPSVYNIEFSFCDIIRVGKEMGYKLDTQLAQDKFIENWFSFVEYRTYRLFRKYFVENVDYSNNQI